MSCSAQPARHPNDWTREQRRGVLKGRRRATSRESLPFDEFARDFGSRIRYQFDFERPLYALILGAGVSRSAGIPLASEMVRALKRGARLRRVSLGKARGESELSWCFRKLWAPDAVKRATSGGESHAASAREFLLSCIHRAQKEANVSHLVAAHLATAGIANPIITTNFDDLAVAAFWELPWTSADDEPHVIYDPEGAVRSNPRIADRVPIVLKAHGHHTSYGLGYLDRQIARAAPHVHKLMARLPRPTHGYIVVGYSGGWDDGVMQAFADPALMADKTIYWLYAGKREPDNKLIDRAGRHARIVFVRIESADLAFLRLWAAVPEDDGDGENVATAFGVGRHLLVEHLFSTPRGSRFDGNRKWSKKGYDWFNANLIQEDGQWKAQDAARLEELRRDLLPILDRIHAVDEKYLIADCTAAFRDSVPRKHEEETRRIEEVEMRELAAKVPVPMEWTRRNRVLLRLGLSESTGLQLGTLVLSGLSALSADLTRE
jgi:hypothetical protein